MPVCVAVCASEGGDWFKSQVNIVVRKIEIKGKCMNSVKVSSYLAALATHATHKGLLEAKEKPADGEGPAGAEELWRRAGETGEQTLSTRGNGGATESPVCIEVH